MTRKSWMAAGLASALIAALLAGAFYASPWWAVHQLRQAARERDVDAVLARVDQPALRQSVRLAVGFRLAENAAGAADAAVAGAMVDPITEAMSSSTLLITMLLQGHPSLALQRPGAMTLLPPTASTGDWPARLQYLDRSTVEVRAADAPDAGGFVLRRHGLFDWKLSGLKWPA